MNDDIWANCPQCGNSCSSFPTGSPPYGTQAMECDDCGAIFEVDWEVRIEVTDARIVKPGNNWEDGEDL